jgi:endonuclease YncB( thermonuclease family)
MGGKLERRIIIGAVLASALIATIVAAIILAPKERARAELPTLYVGDEWVYRSIDNITYTLYYRVNGEEMVDNENFYVIETSYDPPWRGNFSRGTTWVKKAAGDTMKAERSGKYRGTPFTTTWTYAYQYLGVDRWPIEVGKEYSMIMTVTVSTPPYKPTVETVTLRAKVEKMESITVPAGTFTCFKVVNYDENYNILSTVWYSDEVKRNVKTIAKTGETTELVSYSIKDGSLAISGPSEIYVDENATFTITSRNSPVENAVVRVGDNAQETGSDGRVTFTFNQPGDFAITVTKEGYETASFPIIVKTPPVGAPHYEVLGCVYRVNDGDTIDVGVLKLVAELNPRATVSTGVTEGVRFGGGLDAPEIWSHTPPISGEPGAVEAMELVESLTPSGTLVYLDLDDNQWQNPESQGPYRDVYGRFIAVVYVQVGGRWVNVNAEVLRWGLRAYPDFDWLKYSYFICEFNAQEWLAENYPYVLD